MCRLPLRLWAVLSLLLGIVSSGAEPSTVPPSIRVAHYNVQNYLVMDRFLKDEKRNVEDAPKPEKSIAALIRMIVEVNPDILHVAEMGPPEQFEDFRRRLKESGLDYADAEYVQGADPNRHIALLSRFPITRRRSLTNLSFELNGVKEPVQRGFLDVDVQVSPTLKLRILGAHLKSRRPVPAGEALLRRNEALLLRKHIEGILSETPDENLLLVGDLNDTKDQPAIKELIGVKGSPTCMQDLWLHDAVGDRWTHYWDTADDYSRIDYILVGPALLPRVEYYKSGILRAEDWAVASDHRPIFVNLRTGALRPPRPKPILP